MVQPVLDYASSVWDPPHRIHQSKLERVQTFAGRIATRWWAAKSSELRAVLGWPLLQARRGFQKLCVCRRILSDESLIPATVFTPHPGPLGLRHCNSRPLFRPRVRMEQHGASFFQSIIPLWNGLPDSVVSCRSHLGYKCYLRRHLLQRN